MSLISNLIITINRQQFDGQHVMNQREEAGELRNGINSKVSAAIRSDPLSPINRLLQTKWIKLVKDNLLPSGDVLVPNMRVWKLNINPKVWQFCCWGSYFVLWRDWRIRRRWLRKTPFSHKFKVIASKSVQVICFIFWASLYSTESHQKMKTENSWPGEQV